MLVRLAPPPFGLDDPRDLVIKPAERHGLADRLVAREEGERHALVEYDDVLRALHVRLADEPPVEQRFMRHVEIARADRVNRRLRATAFACGQHHTLRPCADRAGFNRIRDGGNLLLGIFIECVQLAALLRDGKGHAAVRAGTLGQEVIDQACRLQILRPLFNHVIRLAERPECAALKPHALIRSIDAPLAVKAGENAAVAAVKCSPHPEWQDGLRKFYSVLHHKSSRLTFFLSYHRRGELARTNRSSKLPNCTQMKTHKKSTACIRTTQIVRSYLGSNIKPPIQSIDWRFLLDKRAALDFFDKLPAKGKIDIYKCFAPMAADS